jgi:hypothetical protein
MRHAELAEKLRRWVPVQAAADDDDVAPQREPQRVSTPKG